MAVKDRLQELQTVIYLYISRLAFVWVVEVLTAYFIM